MLAYILAIALALASLALYLLAFFVPEAHRKDDFLWSGVGLFYALVLWICAGRMTGSVLLGQTAALILIFTFGWQTLRLRRAIAHPDQQTDLDRFSVINGLQKRFSRPKTVPSVPPSSVKTAPSAQNKVEETVTPPQNEITVPIVEETPSVTQVIETPTETINQIEEEEDFDFDPFIMDNEAETVIEAYKPSEISSSSSTETSAAEVTPSKNLSIDEKTAETPEDRPYEPE